MVLVKSKLCRVKSSDVIEKFNEGLDLWGLGKNK